MGKPKYSATANSAELPRILAGEVVEVNEDGGRIRMKRATITASAALAADSTIALCILPKNARIIGGAIQFSAFGAGRTLDLGIVGADNSGYIDDDNSTADDVDFFLDGIDVSAAGQDTFAELAQGDGNAHYLTVKELLLLATVLGDTMPEDGTLTVEVRYVVD